MKSKITPYSKTMKKMNVGLACVLGGLGVIASSMTAQALDFNFSFNGNLGGNPGTATGIIRGVDSNGGVGSASVEVFSSPIADTINKIFIGGNGKFTISNGNISDALDVGFYNGDVNRSIIFSYAGGGQFFNTITNQNGGVSSSDSFFNADGFNGVTYTAAATAVPFDFHPAEGAALGVPLFIGLGILRKRIARKSTASKTVVAVS